MKKEEIDDLNGRFSKEDPKNILRYFIENYNNKICFASSLGLEDQVITHMISEISKEVCIFTLDTGRLFPETYDLIHRTNKRYGINMEVVFPFAADVENMVRNKGINLFYDSVENRIECCNIRKVFPLRKALRDKDAWITGIRREQAETRNDAKAVEWDYNNGLIKVSPLIAWTEVQLREYIDENNIPINSLHSKGYVSIGCQPCTRAISEGEIPRDGRWWWEEGSKECGLHLDNNDKNK